MYLPISVSVEYNIHTQVHLRIETVPTELETKIQS